MRVFRVVKPYKKRLERRFTEQIERKQVNFTCDNTLILNLKIFANALEVPLYVLIEHVLQLGLYEVSNMVEDDTMREILQRHLVSEHLLVKQLNPMEKAVSQRALRIENTLKLLELIETSGKSGEEIEQALGALMERTR